MDLPQWGEESINRYEMRNAEQKKKGHRFWETVASEKGNTK
jgi:hypothetical protein